MISLNKHIFVCGGCEYGESGNSNLFGKYSIENDKWSSLKSMNFCRECFSIVAFGKYLYVIGGLTSDVQDEDYVDDDEDDEDDRRVATKVKYQNIFSL